MFCSKCGTSLTVGTAFCPVCGTPVPGTAPSAALPGQGLGAPGLPGTPGAPVMPAAAGVSPHWLPTPTRTYAGFWLRFVAYLIDSAVIGVVALMLCVPLVMLTGIGAGLRGLHPVPEPDPAAIAAFISSIWLIALIAIAGGWLYYAYCESSEWQGTPGKKILNLVVTDLEGNRVTFGRASGRFFAKMISHLIPFGIAYIMAGFTERKQALHDMIASCLVLRS